MASSQPIEGADCSSVMLPQNMGIDLRGTFLLKRVIIVAKQFLHSSNIVTRLQKMSGTNSAGLNLNSSAGQKEKIQGSIL